MPPLRVLGSVPPDRIAEKQIAEKEAQLLAAILAGKPRKVIWAARISLRECLQAFEGDA